MQISKILMRQGALSLGLLAFLFVGCNPVSRQEKEEALAFLYQYMPLPDSVDYPRQYWERCVETTLKARHEMPWGQKVPELEWKHFVLPVRVNNENLDDARTVLYEELRDRVRSLSMRDAVLEVNHWCHEHVTYQPSDARTSSPLATMASAIGRCGEESTFCVAALRAVGIPARQVYTPRWSHTDDNHAWVEAWVDGEWHFLGACEPEPVLDLGWFNAPAARGMLMHTRVFGRYEGPEQVLSQSACYTEINVTSNYAEVSPLVAHVTDAQGQPVEGASVSFRLYNYAEFYPLATFPSDAQGYTSLTSGRGDLLVWATHEGRFGFTKASVGQQDTVQVVLDKDSTFTGEMDLDLLPPPERDNMPKTTHEQRQANKVRLAQEDSLRNAYMAAAFTHDSTDQLMVKARANHQVLAQFLKSMPNEADGRKLLGTLSDKDLRDVSREVLDDHFLHLTMQADSLWLPYVASPRVSQEMLTPWRQVLGKAFAGKQAADIIQWVQDSICVDGTRNPIHLCMSPLGVLRHRVTDGHSRDIFFVALARSLNIPARIDPVTGKVQLMGGSKTQDVYFDSKGLTTPEQGVVMADYQPTPTLDNPKYYSHFTISKVSNEGRLQLLNYEEGEIDMGGGTTYDNLLRKGTHVDAGGYLMVSGTRLASGSVLAHLQFFTVAPHDTTRTHLVMRQSTNGVQVIGSFDSESRYTDAKTGEVKSVLSTTGRGYFVVAVLGVGQEPTNHALRDISAVREQFEKWGQKMVLLFTSRDQYNKYMQRDEFKSLPATVRYGIDQDGKILTQIRREMKLDATTLPVFIIADTFNRVVFVSQGYTIGLGEQMMNVINKL